MGSGSKRLDAQEQIASAKMDLDSQGTDYNELSESS